MKPGSAFLLIGRFEVDSGRSQTGSSRPGAVSSALWTAVAVMGKTSDRLRSTVLSAVSLLGIPEMRKFHEPNRWD